MKAVVWRGPGEVEVAEVAEPVLVEPTDAIVAVSLAAICGTDLHAYRGEVEAIPTGTVLGHEFVGMVAAVGPAVGGPRVGDRVLASDLVACGACWWCERGWHYQCPQASLFGYGSVVGEELPGGQAELVRVPRADVVLRRLEPAVGDADAIFVGDVLATAHMAVAESGLSPGGTMAVVGCGPVGLCTVMCGLRAQAGAVCAVDPNPARRARAAKLGAVPVDLGDRAQFETDAVVRGADVVVEAVGSDASLQTALDLVRPRGTVVVVGAHHSEVTPISTLDAFARELTIKFVVGDPIAVRDELLEAVADGELRPASLVSHRFPLEQGAEAYRLFDRQEAVKVVLVP
jgi:threonine dehydrogenase-like Zn-dependent dehydrogenase